MWRHVMTSTLVTLAVSAAVLAAPSPLEGPVPGAVEGQQPRLVNGRLDPRPAGQGLDRTFRGLVDSATEPVWIGYAVYGLAYLPWGALALIGQAIIVGSIFGVTGIPPTENQAIRSKGDAYRDYQKRVSRFVPMPPKRARPGVTE